MSSLFTYQPAASYKPIPSLGMLCTLCTSLDFSLSSLQIDPYPPLYWPTAISTKYYATSHQPSLLTLFASAEQGCPLCTLIRSELFHIRGHESQEERHQGPVELRVYVTDEEAKGRSVNLDVSSGKQMQAVARTKTRDVKVMLDFMQFERSCPRTFHTHYVVLYHGADKVQHILRLSSRAKYTVLYLAPAATSISSSQQPGCPGVLSTIICAPSLLLLIQNSRLAFWTSSIQHRLLD